MNINELISEFANSVAAQTEAISKGDSDVSNKHAERYTSAFEKLRAHGDDGRDALTALLADDRPDVRVMAAAYLLRYCEDKAKAVLEAEAQKTGLVAFGAAQALQRWKDGTWALDPQ